MTAGCISEPELSSADQENDFEYSGFMILNRSEVCQIPKSFGLLGCKPNFFKNWMFSGTKAGLQSCHMPRYLPLQSRGLRSSAKVRNGYCGISRTKFGFGLNYIRSIFKYILGIDIQVDK